MTIRFKIATVATVLATVMASNALPVFAQEDAAKAEKSEKAEKGDKKGTVVAKVDGESIYSSEVKAMEKILPKQLLQQAKDKKKLWKGLRNQLVDLKIITDAAKNSGVEKDPKVQAAIDQAILQVKIQAFLGKEVGQHLNEKAVKEAYDAYVKEFPKGKEEVKVRHVVVKDEATAKKIIKRLEEGEDFLKLAREFSIDKSTASEGGDLGYISEGDMVPPMFLKAAMELKSGGFSKSPVKSDFGWHILKVDDRRKAKPHALEEVKEDIGRELQEKAMLKLVKDLRGKVKVELFDENGKPDKEGFDLNGGNSTDNSSSDAAQDDKKDEKKDEEKK
ncbi:peptidylprolyl isomerase [Candidatus Nucleicultrix amoebiphila]|jgi:peptidyl-prolyl cis-trans isomerase C|uniref:Parvulin-like PPIase n=1 Tax=Candidatus Nucleicultrix amoebiphila FS5 TaxID=1414854 RepID=A0A1W6N4C2_9PROT|nr:peptidylprolyl isomerase [Candidatus Nucleicultrix amoebiphila]ARN84608.1 hypothetical protein GQ61_03965 [Candidatus Nucleicultrix amoebiphila FS5]